MTVFRPCIDLHDGSVKQIVGGTLTDTGAEENFVAKKPASWFASKYRADGLRGGHVIQLGPGNRDAALDALRAYPGGLQVGGGITADSARQWLDAGACQVIVTSYLFDSGELSMARLQQLGSAVEPQELVVDLSCRRVGTEYFVSTNRWQTITAARVDEELLQRLAPFCSEFLVHAADVEGLRQGIDQQLVELLGRISPLACTYAGGGRHISDLELVDRLSGGRVDLTFGSALDLFGGATVSYDECVAYNQRHQGMGT